MTHAVCLFCVYIVLSCVTCWYTDIRWSGWHNWTVQRQWTCAGGQCGCWYGEWTWGGVSGPGGGGAVHQGTSWDWTCDDVAFHRGTQPRIRQCTGELCPESARLYINCGLFMCQYIQWSKLDWRDEELYFHFLFSDLPLHPSPFPSFSSLPIPLEVSPLNTSRGLLGSTAYRAPT